MHFLVSVQERRRKHRRLHLKLNFRKCRYSSCEEKRKRQKKFAKNIPWLTSKTNHVIPVRNISLVKKISASNRQEERWVHTFTAVNLIVTCRMTEVKFENSENGILKYVQLKHLQPIPTCCAREKIDLDGHETVTFKIVTRSAWQTWFVATVWMIIAVSISAAGQQSQCCKRSGLDERHHSVNFLLVIVDDGKNVSKVGGKKCKLMPATWLFTINFASLG